MSDTIPNLMTSSDADLFREEAARARRFAEAVTDKDVIDRLNRIAEIYDTLALGHDPGPTDRE